MFERRDEALGELLLQQGLVGAAQLDALRQGLHSSGASLATSLLAEGLLPVATLLRAVAGHLRLPWVHPAPPDVEPVTGTLLSRDLVRRYGVLPWKRTGAAVAVLAADPFDARLRDELPFAAGVEIRVWVADPRWIVSAIERDFADADDVPRALPGSADATPEAVVEFVDRVLDEAVRRGASDVHLEPFASDFRIRCRIDGVLEEVPPPPRAWAAAMTSRIKVLAGMDIAERRLPQDGRLCVRRAGRDVDLRVSTLPTQSGESVVLRVLDRAAVRLSLDEVGLPDSVRTEVRQRIRQPHGIFIVTGPTGSGKTTTLYSCLQEINAPDAKLLTVEDPVEYAIDGVTQVGVNVPAGLEFAAAMRAFLRQDPDVIMVGEMRDTETAATAVQAALTGHLVLSTLHTNDAPGALTRLVDMGIEPFLVAATVEGILAQRLVRRICPACRAPVAVSPKVQATPPQAGEDTGEIAWFAGRGCPDCAQTGYRGRRALFEWLPVSETLREQLMAGRSLQALRAQAVREGMRTLRQAALELARAGETTREEVLRHT